MKKITILLLAIVMILFACKTQSKTQSKTDSIIITLAKKSGRGISPEYSLQIYNSGKVIFEGIKNTEKIGKYQKQLDKKAIKTLKKTFIDAKFFDFEDEYTSRILDLPTTYISFSENNKTKKIRDYHNAPKELKKLEKLIENIAEEEDNWIKIK